MTFLDRRRFLLASAATLAFKPLTSLAQGAYSQATLTLHPDRQGAHVPENFIGLSYETQQLSDPSFFSPENHGLIQKFRELTPRGVLRLGGNTSDLGWWKPTPDSKQPPVHVRRVEGEPSADLAYALEPQSIVNLRGFLQATGWTCLFGINLGTNTIPLGVDEALFASKTLGWVGSGGKLEYFQLGNEPDLFNRHLRDPEKWTVDAYLDEWLAMARAIHARIPQARFGLPDSAGHPDWYARIGDRLSTLISCAASSKADADCLPKIAAVSHHYYAGGPPNNPAHTVPHLLAGDPHVPSMAETVIGTAAKLHVPYRMTEGNTCYRGGKPGLSDVFAASLWAADYLLYLASRGYAGVNLHGGDGQMVANSLGGTLPGEEIMPDRTVPHPRPFYTPINHAGPDYTLEPVAYGMLFAGHFAGATFMPIDFNPGPVNAKAYAAKLQSGETAVAIINKDVAKPLFLNLHGYHVAYTLSAPSLDAHTASLEKATAAHEISSVPPAQAVILVRR